MKKFLCALALLAMCITPVLAQDKKVEPGAPKKDAPKPLVLTVSQTLPALTADLPLAGESTLPKGAVFLEAVFVPSATIVGSGEELTDVTIKPGKPIAETIKVKGVTKLPAKTVLSKGFILTVPPGTKLPEIPKVVVPPEPTGVRIGLEKVPFSDVVKDPQLLSAYLEKLEKRVTKVEETLKKLTAGDKANRLNLKATGRLHATFNASPINEVDGKPVIFKYSYYQQGYSTKTFVYEFLE